MKKEIERLQRISAQQKDWGLSQFKRDTTRNGMAANHQFLGSIPVDLWDSIGNALKYYGVEASDENIYKVIQSSFPQYLMQGTNSLIRVN